MEDLTDIHRTVELYNVWPLTDKAGRGLMQFIASALQFSAMGIDANEAISMLVWRVVTGNCGYAPDCYQQAASNLLKPQCEKSKPKPKNKLSTDATKLRRQKKMLKNKKGAERWLRQKWGTQKLRELENELSMSKKQKLDRHQSSIKGLLDNVLNTQRTMTLVE